ncbi:MAG: hypothetical protein GC160_11585 [Acidobacteria bacterium]|nr:hypothetical protein [Acidobacteriota bacterium]
MKYQDAFLQAVSISSSGPPRALRDRYDVGLFCPSWDARCRSILAVAEVAWDISIVLELESDDPEGHRAQNFRDVERFVKERSGEVIICKGESVNTAALWEKLHVALRGAWGDRRSSSMFIDYSTCPRFYSLGSFAVGVSSGRVGVVDFFYNEAEYTKTSTEGEYEDYPFSSGRWQVVPIHGLQGSFRPTAPKLFVVSAGFQGDKTARVLSREDPHRVSLLMPIPGTVLEYDAEVRARNDDIVRTYLIPGEQIIEAAAGDAVAAWKRLGKAGLERFEEEDVYYLCCGTKPHSLALALRSITTTHPTVLYNIPERFNYVPVVPTGRSWVYKIRDLSSLLY